MSFSKELSERLAKLEQEQLRQQEEIETISHLSYLNASLLESPKNLRPPRTVQQQSEPLHAPTPPVKKSCKGYKIRLEFGSDSPASEWSEDTRGWRSSGQGSCYPNKEAAQKKFRELKQRWPDYPLKLYALE